MYNKAVLLGAEGRCRIICPVRPTLGLLMQIPDSSNNWPLYSTKKVENYLSVFQTALLFSMPKSISLGAVASHFRALGMGRGGTPGPPVVMHEILIYYVYNTEQHHVLMRPSQYLTHHIKACNRHLLALSLEEICTGCSTLHYSTIACSLLDSILLTLVLSPLIFSAPALMYSLRSLNLSSCTSHFSFCSESLVSRLSCRHAYIDRQTQTDNCLSCAD